MTKSVTSSGDFCFEPNPGEGGASSGICLVSGFVRGFCLIFAVFVVRVSVFQTIWPGEK
jgi:hypothetical protein